MWLSIPLPAARRLKTGAKLLIALSLAGLLAACVYNDNRSQRSSRAAPPPPATGAPAAPRMTEDEESPPRAGDERRSEAERPDTERPDTDRGEEEARRSPGERTTPRTEERKEEARRSPSPPSTASPPRPPPGGKFYVEAGAYSDKRRADRERATLDDLGSVRIAETKRNGQSYYRVWVGPVANAEQGDRLLARIVRRGYNDARVIVE